MVQRQFKIVKNDELITHIKRVLVKGTVIVSVNYRLDKNSDSRKHVNIG